MRIWSVARLGAICALFLMPVGVLAKAKATTPPDPSETPTAASGDATTFTYLGSAYAVDPACFAQAFIVGQTTTTIGVTDLVIVAVPYPGGVAVLPPQDKAASGPLATKAVGDAVCLQPAT